MEMGNFTSESRDGSRTAEYKKKKKNNTIDNPRTFDNKKRKSTFVFIATRRRNYILYNTQRTHANKKQYYI